MKLADQIALLRETLESLGMDVADGSSVGESAADLIKAQDVLLISLKAKLDEGGTGAGEPNDVDDDVLACEQPSTDGLCDSCQYMKDGNLPRLCQNREAWRQEFSHRGYSVKAGYGCSEWDG